MIYHKMDDFIMNDLKKGENETLIKTINKNDITRTEPRAFIIDALDII